MRTLESARKRVKERLPEGSVCPCCGQLAKLYKRKLNNGMARGLLIFYQEWVIRREPLHVPSVQRLARLGGDWAKLQHWGLVQSLGTNKADDDPHRGFWNITSKGVSFVLRKCKVPSHIYLYNQEFHGFASGSEVFIDDALGKSFSYEELMLPSEGAPICPVCSAFLEPDRADPGWFFACCCEVCARAIAVCDAAGDCTASEKK